MPTNLSDPINLQLKDPTCPLVKRIAIPPYLSETPFMVIGWDGSGKDVDTWAGRAAACYYVLASSIPSASEMIGRTIAWHSTRDLTVQTGAGYAINANYDRSRLNFFFAWDDVRGKMVFAAGAIDIVAHELGHAFLDSARPDLWNFAVPEIGAFHESFADIHGITTVMKQDEMLVHAMIETQGDLSRSNVLSQMGIELGTCLFHEPPGSTRPLRDATEFHMHVDSSMLPASAPYDQTSTEPHSLSRVLTGAIYAIMIGIYNLQTESGVDGLVALRDAGRKIMSYMFSAAIIVPAGKTIFRNMANALAFVDHQAGSPYAGIIADVFSRWGMPLSGGLRAIPENGEERIENIRRSEVVKLEDGGLRSQAIDALKGVTLNIPLDEYRRYDGANNLIENHIPNREETRSEVLRYAHHLSFTDRIGEGKEFKVVDGALVRNRTNCFPGG